MYDLSIYGWLLVLTCGLLVGASKTGIPGIGIVVVPLMAMAFPARASVGVLLPMLIFADIFAVTYYHRHAVWWHLVRLIPCALVGIVLGWLVMGYINDQQFRAVIGGIVLLMLIVHFVRTRAMSEGETVPHSFWFAGFMGLLAGFTTMLANAAGPVMIIYLLASRLPKTAFIGTAAWYFFIVNWLKVPFSANLGLINWDSLSINLFTFPLIFAGALAGIFFLKRVPQKIFGVLMQVLAGAAAVHLIWSAFA
jgi:uncharacterized membrane protein YfcA